MARTRYISNIRGGINSPGSLVRNYVIYGDKLVGGGGSQGLYEESATKYFNLGTRLVTPDGRVFRYSKCNATRTGAQAVAFNLTVFSKRTADGGAILPVGITAGDDHCHVTIAATDGSGAYANPDGTVTKDELYGGYLYLYGTNSGATYERENRMIIGNTAKTAGAGTIQCDVEEPFTYAHTVSSIKVEVWPNPWSGLGFVSEGYLSFAGLPAPGTITDGYYFWCQTWGPIRISGQNYNLGETAGERNVWFGPDGSIRSTQIQGASNCSQLAGFVIPRTYSNAGGYRGNTFIMLQVSP